MSLFLFTSQPAMGHLNSLLTIAKHLEAEGHQCVFAGFAPAKVKKTIEDKGFELFGMRPPLASIGLAGLHFFSGYIETHVAVRLFFGGVSYYTRKISGIIDKVHPDAVVSDFGFPGAFFAAENKSIPYAVVYSAGLQFPGEGIPPFGSGLPINEKHPDEDHYRKWNERLKNKITRTINGVRRKFKIHTGENNYLDKPISPWLNLVLTSETSEAPRYHLPANTYFIGPCFAGRKDDKSDFPFDKLDNEKVKIYVSLGTVFNKKPKVFRKIIDGFANDKYQLIVSAGGAYKKLKAQDMPENVLLFERVPQVEILPKVDVVISHGGNNTVNETLAAGKPLLVMPVGGEQGDNAARICYLGAGLRADLRKSTSQDISKKVVRIIDEPGFCKCAKEIAEALNNTDGPSTALKLLDRLAHTKEPVLRPDKYPLTITKDLSMTWE